MSPAAATVKDWNFDLGEIRGSLRVGTAELAAAIVDEARRACPVDTGNMRASIGYARTGNGYAIVVNDEGAAATEFGHDVIREGRKTGHVPARPFLRPAIARAAQRFGQAYGSSVGRAAGSYVGQALGPWGVRVLSRYGEELGRDMGVTYWVEVGEKVADVLEARKGERFKATLALAKAMTSDISARRGGR